MKPIKHFPNLKILSLCHTNIEVISGIQLCKNLEILYLSQNIITKIDGLQNLSNLKRLNLSCNKIKALEGLTDLTSLEFFWINENQISLLENLSTLTRLSDFSIAQNQIQTISSDLNHLSSLESLNLSGNPICSFSEIFKLSQLPKLSRLSLSDPNFNESIICTLTNYQVFVLYYLNTLTSLDCIYITHDSRVFAHTTFTKKKLYYTMKKKSLKRAVASLTSQLAAKAKKTEDSSWVYILALLKSAKAVEREIDELSLPACSPFSMFQCGDSTPAPSPSPCLSPHESLDSYHSRLISKIKEEYQKVCGYNRLLHCLVSKAETWSRCIAKELDLEFSCGGNLRFEEGSPSDSWYKSCCDLVNSRYTHSMEVAVTRVARIHNRLLRSRFEDKLESLVDISDNSYKRNIDYLFYSGEDLMQVINDGFKTPAEYGELGRPGCVPLSYSLETAEILRLREIYEEFDDVHEIFWPKGQVLLCKVYFGKGKGDLRVPYYKEDMTPSEVWELCPFNPPSICWAVYRTFEYDAKQRVWFIFDNALILPEYLIEFEYSSSTFNSPRTQVEAGLESLTRPVNAFFEEELENKSLTPNSADDIVVPSRSLITAPSEFSVQHIARGANSEYLNLFQCEIQDIDWIRSVSTLTTLILSDNNLESLKGICIATGLEKIDLSFNRISRLDGLAGLQKLSELDLHNNCILNLAEIKKLPATLVKLTCFQNEIYWDQKYDEVILSLLPNLVLLDWRNISKNPRRPVYLEINTETFRQAIISPASDISQPNMLGFIESLELENANLTSMRGLSSLKLLKKLNLSDNLLGNIDYLGCCEVLEELNLSGNFIEAISGLNNNLRLKSLDLSYNKVQVIEGLDRLDLLTHLSIENNLLGSIASLLNMQAISELYLSNNRISDIKEVLELKKLANLVALDIVGNSCMKNPRSRMLILYNLYNLKVLNCVAIEASEINQANIELSGILTEDLLEKRCFGLRTTELRQLDLSNSKLRSVNELFTPEILPRLLELNLSNNFFTSLGIFMYLPMLAKLDISTNKIDSFLCGNKGFSGLPNLEILNLAYNSFINFNGLQIASLKNLRIFNISHNSIEKIDLIENLQSLRELDVSYNKIRIVDKKFEVPNIRSVNFDNNGLKHLNFLDNLIWIQAIKASNNRISELSDIDKIQNLPNLLELSLLANPIERKIGYRNGVIKKFPKLLFLDCKEVTEEEKGDNRELNKTPATTQVGRLAAKIASITLDAYFLKIHPRTANKSSRKY